MIRTYLINKNEIDKIDYSEELLSADRRSKIGRLKREDDRKLSACAELLLIYALKKQAVDISLPLNIEADERSKLRLADIPIFFNYSHANEYAACSISDAPIGVDIEYFRVRELLHADRILHPDEYNLLAFISNPNEKKKYFYECWVAKESYLKNLGIGLIVRPRDFVVHEDQLKIGNEEITQLKGHHTLKAAVADAAKEVGAANTADSAARPGAANTADGAARPGAANTADGAARAGAANTADGATRPGDANTGSGSEKSPEEKPDTTLSDNLSYLEKRYVHVLEPGEVRGTDWKFDAGYRIAVCSMEKDNDSIARLVTAKDINEAMNGL